MGHLRHCVWDLGVAFIFSTGHIPLYPPLLPFIHGPCPALPLLWNLLGPLSNWEVVEGRAGLLPHRSVPTWS